VLGFVMNARPVLPPTPTSALIPGQGVKESWIHKGKEQDTTTKWQQDTPHETKVRTRDQKVCAREAYRWAKISYIYIVNMQLKFCIKELGTPDLETTHISRRRGPRQWHQRDLPRPMGSPRQNQRRTGLQPSRRQDEREGTLLCHHCEA